MKNKKMTELRQVSTKIHVLAYLVDKTNTQKNAYSYLSKMEKLLKNAQNLVLDIKKL